MRSLKFSGCSRARLASITQDSARQHLEGRHDAARMDSEAQAETRLGSCGNIGSDSAACQTCGNARSCTAPHISEVDADSTVQRQSEGHASLPPGSAGGSCAPAAATSSIRRRPSAAATREHMPHPPGGRANAATSLKFRTAMCAGQCGRQQRAGCRRNGAACGQSRGELAGRRDAARPAADGRCLAAGRPRLLAH